MLALFRFFLAFFLGVDAPEAERLTDPAAWCNPIAQVRRLEGAAQAWALRGGRPDPTWSGEVADARKPARGGADVPRADRHPRPGTP